MTEEYSPFGVQIANIVIDSPGTRVHAKTGGGNTGQSMLDPMRISKAYYYLHTQHLSSWTDEIQLTPYDRPVTR